MPRLRFQPLTPRTWPDLESLFGPRGACGGCWCMWWRLRRAEWEKGKGRGNRNKLRALAGSRTPPGLLAYVGKEAAGWCVVAPRQEYSLLERSRVLKPVDNQAVWSVTCFFIARRFRKSGMSAELLQAAARFAKKHGARILEGYPIEPAQARVPEVFAYTGFASTFRKAGFREVARRSPTRPIMRRTL